MPLLSVGCDVAAAVVIREMRCGDRFHSFSNSQHYYYRHHCCCCHYCCCCCYYCCTLVPFIMQDPVKFRGFPPLVTVWMHAPSVVCVQEKIFLLLIIMLINSNHLVIPIIIIIDSYFHRNYAMYGGQSPIYLIKNMYQILLRMQVWALKIFCKGPLLQARNRHKPSTNRLIRAII